MMLRFKIGAVILSISLGIGLALALTWQAQSVLGELDLSYNQSILEANTPPELEFDDQGNAKFGSAGYLIGSIRAESVGLNMRLYSISYNNLNQAYDLLDYGAVWDIESAQFGHRGWHFIEGHNIPTFGIKIDQMAMGDTFTVSVGGVDYNYQLDSREISHKDNLNSLLTRTVQDRLLLMTCWPFDSPGTGTQDRLWITGTLIK